MKVKYFLPWLREIGIGLLIWALFLPWYSFDAFGIYFEARGLDFLTNGVRPILVNYLLIFAAYLISKLLPKKSYFFIFAFLFLMLFFVCSSFIYIGLDLGLSGWRSPISHQLGLHGSTMDVPFTSEIGSSVNFIGLIVLSIGILATTKINKEG